MKINYAFLSDVGKKRKVNQDALYVYLDEQWGLFVIADGMGGLSEGERASREIVQFYESWVGQSGKDIGCMPPGTVLTELRRVLSEANEKIMKDTKPGQTCGSTAVILFLREDVLVLVSAGDSRLYELGKKFFLPKLKKLTVDDVWMREGMNSGKLTNAVGISSPLKCHATSDSLKKGHKFLLCTDGVYKYCSEKELALLMQQAKEDDLEQTVGEIRERVYENGAGDNLSMILVYC